ncbi:MAG: beta-N-acetylhexosaminidase [Thermoprotei archaeon]|jgi:beta-N-acetylhexosaminidase
MIDVRYLINQMSLEEKIGNLFMFGFDSTDDSRAVTERLKIIIDQYHVGGIIYFSRNLKSAKQAAELSKSIQSLSRRSNYVLPVIIATDQEGGNVVRLRDGTIFPGNMGLGAIGSKKITYEVGRIIGKELISVGINMNLAPVLDVNTNPVNPVIGIRSFGGDPEMVASLGGAYIEGLHSEGVLAVAKHFPGHGDSSLDSHLDLPIINKDLDELMKIHIKPFMDAISMFNVDAIMTAHVVYPALDKENPATLSRKILREFLREKLGFNGVIMTDDMEMRAISDRYAPGDASIKALKAGADLILFSHTYSKQIEAYNTVLKAVENEYITNDELDEKVRRILQLKLRVIDHMSKIDPSIVGKKEHRDFELEVARKAVTLLKNNNRVLPIKGEREVIIVEPKIGISSQVEEKYQPLYLSEILKNYLKIKSVVVNKDLNDDYYSKFSKLLESNSAAVFLIVISSKDGVEFFNKIVQNNNYNNDTVVVLFKNPFLINYLNTNRSDSIIIGYAYTQCMIIAISELIIGKIKPNGKLPVNLNEEYKIGYGMRDF